tara:strand:- start:201 stop:398 length:198 start_codon:yes stop_codon:yes gene_type:complete
MGACCTKDSSVFADNNVGLSLKYDEESRKLTGEDIMGGVCSCFFNKEHIDYHTYKPENTNAVRDV